MTIGRRCAITAIALLASGMVPPVDVQTKAWPTETVSFVIRPTAT